MHARNQVPSQAIPLSPGDRRQVTIHDRPSPLDHVESQQLFSAEEPQLLRLLAAPQGVVEGFFNVRGPADQAPPSAIAAALQRKRAITFEQGEQPTPIGRFGRGASGHSYKTSALEASGMGFQATGEPPADPAQKADT
jgi:hypothetical protein